MSMLLAAWKVPSPLPSSTLTSLPAWLAVARSSLPSLLKSPTARDSGPVPVAEVRAGWNVPSPLPSSTLTVLLVDVGHGQVELAVVVEVGRHHGLRVRADGVAHGRAEAEQAAVFQDFEVWPMRRGSKRAPSPVMALAPARRQGGAEVLQPTVE